jgi:hypothetical protein
VRVWRGPDGIKVEVIVLQTSSRLKVTQRVNGRTYLLGYCRTIRDVERHVDLADLVEVIAFPRVPGSASRRLT